MITVVCLYKGKPDYSEYDVSYVYKLRGYVSEYLPNAGFVCLSDTEIDGIDTIPIEHDFGRNGSPGWCKIELFKHFREGKFLFIDLSVIVRGDLSKIAELDGFRMVRDFVNRSFYSSCVMVWEGDHSYIFDKFVENSDKYEIEYRPKSVNPWKSGNSQLFVEHLAKGLKPIPDEYVSSYKRSSTSEVGNSVIVKYHGKPRPKDVNYNTFNKDNMDKMVHVVNWGTWGGIQSVVLALAREYKEYKTHVLVLGGSINEDFADLFFRYGISVGTSNDIKRDIINLGPKYVFLHNTVSSKLGAMPKSKYIRVHHGANLGEWGADYDWFVSNWVRKSYKGTVKNEILLPPLITTSDFPKREPKFNKGQLVDCVVGKVQSTTVAGDPTPPQYYSAVSKYRNFIVGRGVKTDAPVRAGLTADYFRAIDILAIYQDKSESWGLSLTEANLMGIPAVVRANNDGMTEQAVLSGGAILVNNKKEFEDALRELNKEKSYREIAEQGSKWCLDNVDASRFRKYI